jgi:hypothetical protein
MDDFIQLDFNLLWLTDPVYLELYGTNNSLKI